MSLQGEAAEEIMTEFICKKLTEKIKKYPEATAALKEIGREIINDLPNIPEWSHKYSVFFRE